MTLLLTIFLLNFVTRLVKWIGEKVLSEYAYTSYLYVTQSDLIQKQRRLKEEILKNKQDLLQTSAQDQFAKWAKLRRTVDKGLAELEKLNSEIASKRSTFTYAFNTFLSAITFLPQIYITFAYQRQPVFTLPPGWFGPLAWFLAFPFAPVGTVSVNTWNFACRSVIKSLEKTVRGNMEFYRQQKTVNEGVKVESTEENENLKVD